MTEQERELQTLRRKNKELSEKVRKLEEQRTEDASEIARLHRQIDALIDHGW